MRIKIFNIILSCIVVLSNFSLSYGIDSNEEMINTTVYEKVSPAIVVIEGNVKNGYSTGSGCIISPDGYILTSSHVINGVKHVEVTTHTGKVYPAKVIKTINGNNDLALLKIETKKNLESVEIGNSSEIKVGQRVLAIGNPFGFNGTLTTGIISRIDYEKNKIQTDAAINPGSSGGPIVNINGEVIGISQSIYNPDSNHSNIGIGFAIPVDEAKPLLKEIKKNGLKANNN